VRRSLVPLLLTAVGGLVLAAIAGTHASAALPMQREPSGRATGVRTVTLVDESRPTPPGPGGPGGPERVLETTVYYPARDAGGDGAAVARGRFPLVVFSHGTATDATTHDRLLRRWAKAGYVVAAPAHPLSKRTAPGGATNDDRDEQPGDQSFVIDALTGVDAPRWLRGHVDRTAIAVAGHSLGAYTSLQTGYGACCADPRVDAVLSFAGLGYGHRGVEPDNDPPPLLLVHDRSDPEVPARFSEESFDAAEAVPRALVLLDGGRERTSHLDAFVGGTRAESRLVAAMTVDWLDWALRGDAGARQRFRAAVAATPDLAELREAG
jgi:dienelactone hydrolase